MNLQVKVCGMTHPEQIERLEDVDYVGLIFVEKSPRNALSVNAASIRNSNCRKVGVFCDAEADYIKETAKRYGLSAIQLHGNESPEFCRQLSPLGLEIWKAISIESLSDLERIQEFENVVNRVVLDTKPPKGTLTGGSGSKFDWSILSHYDFRIPFMLAGGIAPGDEPVLKSLNHTSLIGLDINSKFEIEPGIKDIQKTNQFIKNIKTQ